MTRQEIADALEPINDGLPDGPDDVAFVRIGACRAAAAELRKNCAGCRCRVSGPMSLMRGTCRVMGNVAVPDSGFCHEWSAK
jgi:hypothetical protein